MSMDRSSDATTEQNDVSSGGGPFGGGGGGALRIAYFPHHCRI